MRINKLLSLPILSLMVIALWQLLPGTTAVVHAAPATFTVTNVNDSGAGSLRQAIIDANANGNPGDQDEINFNISGAGDKTIEVQSDLDISESVAINGYTQGDSSANTADFPEPFNGILRVMLKFGAAGGLVHVTGDDVTIKGLVFEDRWEATFDGHILVEGASNFAIEGTYLGTDHDGTSVSEINDVDVSINTSPVVIVDSPQARIGGSSPEQRNVIGYCNADCITVSATPGSNSNGFRAEGNNIGIGADSLTSMFYSRTAIVISEGVDNATIGGTTPGSGNFFANLEHSALRADDVAGLSVYGNLFFYNKTLTTDRSVVSLFGVTEAQIGSTNLDESNFFGGNFQHSIRLNDSVVYDTPSQVVSIEGNIFGYNYDQSSQFGNGSDSVFVEGNSDEVLISENTIHNSGQLAGSDTTASGVTVDGSAQNVSVLGNSIYNSSGIGIDLGSNNGMDTNDNLDSDTGANGRLNTPGYTSIVEGGGDTEVTFTMDVPAGDYRIEFFSNTAAETNGDPGEGETFIGATTVTSTGTGNQEFVHILTGTGHTNMALTATEVDNTTFSGYGATSEFGAEGAPYLPYADLSVTTVLDNPDDIALTGDTASITVTITNSGPNSFDLSSLNSTSPSSDFLFMTLLPAELNYSSISGSGIACNDLGPGSASGFGTDFENHTGYGVLTCGYTGGSGTIASGQSRTFTISATVMTPRDTGFQIFTILNTPETDPDYDDYTTVIESGADYIDGFAALNGSVDNYSVTTFSHGYESDLYASKSLLNSEDFATGNILNYQITITNNGPDALDLNLYDTPAPGSDSIFLDVLPAHLTYSGISGTGIVCNDFGPNSAGFFGPVLGNHSDHSVVVCASDGNSPVLDTGESISYTLSAEVLDDSDPIFYNHIYVNVIYGDPEGPAVGAIFGGGSDLLDGMQAQGINNYAAAYSQPANASVTKTLDNPEDVAVGASLNYTLTFTNNGPFSIDPTMFDGSGINPLPNSLFVDLMPPNLSYVSQSNPDLNCTWLGPGSASITGLVFGNHSDYSLLICVYTGSVTDLANDQSISTTITTTADSVPSSFANYLVSSGSSVDPDNSFLTQQLSGAGNYDDGDALDNILASEVNNAVLAAYTAPPSEETPPADPGSGNSSNGGSSNSGSGNGGLTLTGQVAWTAAAVTTLTASVILLAWLKKSRRKH